jgi:hypothetical protein
MRVRIWSSCLAGLALGPLACGSEGIVTLGRAVPDPLFGDGGRPVAALNTTTDEDSPTLTEDLLEIYFTSRGSGLGDRDVWFAQRSDRADAFGMPRLVMQASSPADEVSPAISRDGLTLWVGSDRLGGVGELDIWQVRRASRQASWEDPTNVTQLNSPSDDIPRPLALGGRLMPLASRRDDPRYLQTYLAVRSSDSVPFERVDPVDELWLPGVAMSGGFLTEDGLLLFFDREVSTRGDLYLAWRRSTSERFRPALALDALNSEADDRAPWINSEQTRFFFASDRDLDRGLDILGTTLDLPRFE